MSFAKATDVAGLHSVAEMVREKTDETIDASDRMVFLQQLARGMHGF